MATRRGTLRVYLGAAPGVGKTYDMLGEGRRAKERGTDVVVGFVETHGRPKTAEQVGDLEVVPRRQIAYRGTTFEEMDLDAVLDRRPQRVLVDELAHTNVPGSRNEKRWQDVEELLDAGIDVITTVNIQHLESLNDVVERITGIHQRETVPDEVVRAADQVELVDQTPEALRRRMAHGNIYKPDKIDAALSNYFRTGNLAALRELALLWLADKVDVGLEDYRERHRITETWETRERVVVGLDATPGTDALIRRAARIAQRARGDLVGVHVTGDDGLARGDTTLLEAHRRLLTDLGGEFHEVASGDTAAALVEFARAENATQIVLGESHRSRVAELVQGSIINRVIRLSGAIDVHVVSDLKPEQRVPAERVRRRIPSSPLSARRRAASWTLAAIALPVLTFALTRLRTHVSLPAVLLLYLALVVTIAAVGGTAPALLAAVAGFLAANWYFVPPIHTWTITEGENVVALLVFLGVALLVSRYVDTAARRTAEAARARSEARTLASLAATMSDEDPVGTMLAHLRSVFALDSAALLRETGEGWQVEAASGDDPPGRPDRADQAEHLAPGVVLALTGPPLAAHDQTVLRAFAHRLADVLEHRRLRAEAGRAQSLAEANALRGALLQAVSHDLRTPLASIKASASSLAQRDVAWTDEERAEFVETICAETDRLTALVANLLDMSRIQAGALQPERRPVPLEEVVAAAVRGLGSDAARVEVDVPETLPPVLTDPALLERAVANLVHNAVRHAPDGTPVRVQAGAFGDSVDLRIVDQGPGIPPADRDRVFQPFQRLGDQQPATGVGLGLAVARGFLAATGASVDVEDTPGGGTTMCVTLPV